jgi:hypothetical protein
MGCQNATLVFGNASNGSNDWDGERVHADSKALAKEVDQYIMKVLSQLCAVDFFIYAPTDTEAYYTVVV